MCIDYFCSPLKYSVAPSVRVDCGFRPWIGVAFTWMSRHQPGGAPTTPEQRTTRTKHSHLHTEGFSPSCSCFYFRVSSDCCRLTGFCESGTRPMISRTRLRGVKRRVTRAFVQIATAVVVFQLWSHLLLRFVKGYFYQNQPDLHAHWFYPRPPSVSI